MHITTFEEDLIGLEEFSRRLENFIITEHEYVEGSLVIALTSKYGSGKTTFLEMWKSSLDNSHEKDNMLQVISLNAWESDYYGDPLFAIVSAIVECLDIGDESTTNLVNAAKDFGWFATAIASQVANKLTGVDAVAAGDFADKKREKRSPSALSDSDTFSIYQGRKAAMDSLKAAIKELVSDSKPKVLFLVDELDRCRPDYAITYLETIKHIFDVKGAVFLLAADKQQLENSARTAFGENLDFEEYYRKFVHREIALPPITGDGYRNLASKYVPYYLERDGARHCFMNLESHRVDNITEIIGALKLTPRQIQEVFRVLGHILSTSEEQKGRLLWCLAVGSILMSALRVGDIKAYNLLGTQQFEAEDAIRYLNDLVGSKDSEWWFTLLLTGGGLHIKEGETSVAIMKRAGLIDKDAEQDDLHMRQELGQWSQGWGHSMSSRFKQIYENIEQINQWK